MNRRRKNIAFRVGAFLFFGILILFGYVMTIGEGKTVFRVTQKYHILLEEANGLFNGSLVTVNGMPAGTVSDINFIKETGKVDILITVLKKYVSTITDQSEAFLATKGLLGDKYVAITTAGEKGNQLPPQGYISTREEQTGILNLLGEEDDGDKLSAILDEALIFLKKLNNDFPLEKAGQTFDSTEKAVDNFSHFFSDDKSKELAGILERTHNILKKIDEGEGTLGSLINNKRIYNRILSTLGIRTYNRYLPGLVEEEDRE